MLTLAVCFSGMDKMSLPTDIYTKKKKKKSQYRTRRIPNDFYCSVHVRIGTDKQEIPQGLPHSKIILTIFRTIS